MYTTCTSCTASDNNTFALPHSGHNEDSNESPELLVPTEVDMSATQSSRSAARTADQSSSRRGCGECAWYRESFATDLAIMHRNGNHSYDIANPESARSFSRAISSGGCINTPADSGIHWYDPNAIHLPIDYHDNEFCGPHYDTHARRTDYEVAGRAPDHTFKDLRSAHKARRRNQAEKQKYWGYRAVKRGQLGALHCDPDEGHGPGYSRFGFLTVPVPEAATIVMNKRMLWEEAQNYPRPPKYHRSHRWDKLWRYPRKQMIKQWWLEDERCSEAYWRELDGQYGSFTPSEVGDYEVDGEEWRTLYDDVVLDDEVDWESLDEQNATYARSDNADDEDDEGFELGDLLKDVRGYDHNKCQPDDDTGLEHNSKIDGRGGVVNHDGEDDHNDDIDDDGWVNVEESKDDAVGDAVTDGEPTTHSTGDEGWEEIVTQELHEDASPSQQAAPAVEEAFGASASTAAIMRSMFRWKWHGSGR